MFVEFEIFISKKLKLKLKFSDFFQKKFSLKISFLKNENSENKIIGVEAAEVLG
jgi:hypothetical protein